MCGGRGTALSRMCAIAEDPFWGLLKGGAGIRGGFAESQQVHHSCMCSSGKTTFLSVLMERASYGVTEGSVRLRLEPEDVGAGARSSYSISELR